MNADIWVLNLDPYLVRFGDSFGIRWYGLAYAGGFFAGLALVLFILRRGRGPLLPAQEATDFLAVLVAGTLLGGRLGYAVFYDPGLLSEFTSQFPYWELLHVWQGGMASHGGIVGASLGCVIFATLRRQSWLHLADLVTLGGSVGIFLGRCANFVNGELFGRPVAPDFPLAVKFPNEVFLWLYHDLQPAVFQLETLRATAAVRALGTVNLKDWDEALRTIHTAASEDRLRAILGEVVRAIQTGNAQVTAALATELTPRYPSQLLEAALEGALLFAVTMIFWRRPRKPGVVASLWLTLYSAVRILGEEFRLPDPQLGFGLWGLTRGQWLSLGLLAVGAASFHFCQRRDSAAIGGWNPGIKLSRSPTDKSSESSQEGGRG